MNAQDEDDEDGPVNHWQPHHEQPLLLRELTGDVPEAARALLAAGGTVTLHELLEAGRVFVLGDVADAGEGPYAAAAIVSTVDGPMAMLAAVATDRAHPDTAERLLRGIAEHLCGEGITTMCASMPPLASEHRPALERAGFRLIPTRNDAGPPSARFERTV